MGQAQSSVRGDKPSLDIAKHFFTERVVKYWNRLSKEFISAPHLSVFQKHLGFSLIIQARSLITDFNF